MNEYYDSSGYPQTGASGSSASMRAELDSVEAGFNKLPTLTANGNKLVKVNSAGTGLETTSVISDDGTNATVSGDLTIAGGNVGVDADSMHAIPNVATDTLTLNAAAQTLTNKTIVVANNTITTAPSGNLTSTNLNSALAELQDDIDTRELSINAAAAKVTPVNADAMGLIDSAAANTLKKITWANIKATLKSYFDTIYVTAGSFAASGANSDITSLSALSTPLSVAQGGTGANTNAGTAYALKGANGDITSLTALTNIAAAAVTIAVDDKVLIQDTSATDNIKTVTAQSIANIATSKIVPITASVAVNALTITLNPTTLDFRDATLTSGAVNTRNISAAISVVISSGSTLGTVNAVQNRLAVLAIDNAGTVELAVVNMSGGVNLDETGVISTTAEGGAGAADSATVIYSNTARTNVAYRVVGFVQSTQATAGTWGTAPSTIQGYGGQAFAAMSSIGYGQTWQTVTGSRAASTTYYNTTGKPIQLSIPTAASLTLTINGINVVATSSAASQTAVGIVPVGGSYSVNAAFTAWHELR